MSHPVKLKSFSGFFKDETANLFSLDIAKHSSSLSRGRHPYVVRNDEKGTLQIIFPELNHIIIVCLAHIFVQIRTIIFILQ